MDWLGGVSRFGLNLGGVGVVRLICFGAILGCVCRGGRSKKPKQDQNKLNNNTKIKNAYFFCFFFIARPRKFASVGERYWLGLGFVTVR